MGQIEKSYVFDAPEVKVTLADLFDGRTQLFIKHFMMGPARSRNASAARWRSITSTAFSCTSRTTTSLRRRCASAIAEIEAVRRRMGWRFRWVSSYGSDFKYDFNVSFTPDAIAEGRAYYNYEYTNPGLEDRSGDSIFYKDDDGQIFHTYSAFGRGGEEFLGIYRYLEATPKGRNETGPHHTLTDWVRLRNTYGEGGMVEANGRYHAPGSVCAAHQQSATT